MSLTTLRSFLRSLLRRARMERDMDSELQFHLDARVDDLVAGGLDRAAARRRARHVLAILLAALGLYGVTTYAMAARTREIGVRMALGASPSAIFALIFRQTTMLIGLELIVGLALALTGVGYLRSLLFGLEPPIRSSWPSRCWPSSR